MFSTVAALANLTVLKQLFVSLKQLDFKTIHAAGPSPTPVLMFFSLTGAGGTKGPTHSCS